MAYNDTESIRWVQRIMAITFRIAKDISPQKITRKWVARYLNRSEEFVKNNWLKNPYDCHMKATPKSHNESLSQDSKDVVTKCLGRSKKSVNEIVSLIEEQGHEDAESSTSSTAITNSKENVSIPPVMREECGSPGGSESGSDDESLRLKSAKRPCNVKRGPRKRGRRRKDEEQYVHDIPSSSYPCLECGSILSSKLALKKHINIVHRKLRPYVCPQCCHAFSTLGMLTKHVKVVHERIKIKCQHCDSTFQSKRTLFDHSRAIHGDVKNHQCRKCSQAFDSETELLDHTKSSHRNYKSYRCSKCNLLFDRRAAMLIHVDTVHLNFKSYPCTSCQSRFNSKEALANHFDAVHSELKHHQMVPKKFNCELCKQNFSLKQSLTVHIEMEHPECKEQMLASTIDFILSKSSA